MPAASSSPIDPCDWPVAGPRALPGPRGGDAPVTGRGSESSSARGALPTDHATRKASGSSGYCPMSPTYRSTLQSFHADALDDLVGARQAAANDHAMLKKTLQGP
jgi:hypothetical protein